MAAQHYDIPTKYELVLTPCWCGGETFSQVASRDRFGQALTTVMCQRCGTLLLNPYMTDADAGRYYADDYLDSDYNHSFAERFSDRAKEQRQLQSLVPLLPKGADVLDFGCGCGGVTNFLLDLGHTVFGHDLSEDALAHALSTGLSPHVKGNTYDAVVSYHSVEHHVDPAATIGEMAQMLKPGGLLFIAVPLINRIVAGARPEGIVGELYFPHRWYFSVNNFDLLVSRFGLRRVLSDYETVAIYKKDERVTARVPGGSARRRARLRLWLINTSPKLIKLRGMARLLWAMRKMA